MISKVMFAVVLMLAGCATPPWGSQRTERIILLPSESSTPSAVIVKTRDAEAILDKPYSKVEIRGTTLVTTQTSAEDVKRLYSGLLSAQPRPPQTYTLFFVSGTDELTAASKIAFEDARRQVASWSAAEIVVIGHTDRTGSEEFNDSLSLERAQVIASRLESEGISSDVIEVAARGEREPLVETGKGISEPRNRRVEIKVR
jgi:outer membrane protein OmpA-like peptidoglycan-associated protein